MNVPTVVELVIETRLFDNAFGYYCYFQVHIFCREIDSVSACTL